MSLFIYSGVLPFAFNPSDGKRYYLLGRESYDIDSGKWSSFGGSPEEGESFLQTAAREMYEESMAIFGEPESLELSLEHAEYFYSNNAYVFLLEVMYDENLPEFYSGIHNYMLKGSKGIKHGFLEKCELAWIEQDKLNQMIELPRLQHCYCLYLRGAFLKFLKKLRSMGIEL